MTSWQRQLGFRLRRLFLLKFVGISAFMWLFFVGYFEMLRHPTHPVMTMPLTAIDHLVPLQPAMLFAYLSLWLYVGIVPGLMLGVRQLLTYGLWAAAMCGVGLACFYFWPTSVPPTGIDVSGQAGFSLLRGVDAPGNACPSMHVASAAFSVLWLESLLRDVQAPRSMHWLNRAWFIAIAYSTLATKQHVALDLFAGVILGVMFAWPSLALRPSTPRATDPTGYDSAGRLTAR